MNVRERMGTSVRTIVKVKATTDGDQHQDTVEVTTKVWVGERRTSKRVSTRGYRQSAHDLRCNGL